MKSAIFNLQSEIVSLVLHDCRKRLGSRLAPPTSAPSISSSAIRAFTFSGFTEPRRGCEDYLANSSPKGFSCFTANQRVGLGGQLRGGVLPVPMAQTGS